MSQTTQIPFVNLLAQYKSIQEEIDSAIHSVLESTAFVMGGEVKAFEEEFAHYCRARHCRGVGNGTDALVLALRALRIGPGDLVITPPNTFIATTEAITHVGARTIFVDIDPLTFHLDLDRLEEKVTSLRERGEPLKAIIAVHLFGQPCVWPALERLAAEHDLLLVEDAAQAHGGEWDERRVGSLGDIACFSFYPGKNLGAYGDGGAVVTNDDELAEKVGLLRNHGCAEKHVHEMEGVNSRLDSLQAAVLRVKLRHLEKWTENRIATARRYGERLADIESVVVPRRNDLARHVYHLYVIRTKARDALREHLQSQGVSTGIHYPIPLHLQPAYRYLGHQRGDFPAAEAAADEILSLPMDGEVTADQVDHVCDTVRDFVQ